MFNPTPTQTKSPLGPQKINKSTSNVKIEGKIKNESWSITKPLSNSTLNIKPAHLAQKVKNDPKFKSKLNIRIQGIIENKSCSTT